MHEYINMKIWLPHKPRCLVKTSADHKLVIQLLRYDYSTFCSYQTSQSVGTAKYHQEISYQAVKKRGGIKRLSETLWIYSYREMLDSEETEKNVSAMTICDFVTGIEGWRAHENTHQLWELSLSLMQLLKRI